MIKLLADENIPIKTVNALRRKGINIISVTEFSPGSSDRKVLNIANRKERIVVTFDKDFGELIFKEKLKSKGLILLRYIPRSPQQLAKRIEHLLTTEIPIENHILIVKEDNIRVIPLK